MQDSEIIIALITGFGSVIVILLGIIGYGINSWKTGIENRVQAGEDQVEELKVTVGQHSTEIKNIYHRIRS